MSGFWPISYLGEMQQIAVAEAPVQRDDLSARRLAQARPPDGDDRQAPNSLARQRTIDTRRSTGHPADNTAPANRPFSGRHERHHGQSTAQQPTRHPPPNETTTGRPTHPPGRERSPRGDQLTTQWSTRPQRTNRSAADPNTERRPLDGQDSGATQSRRPPSGRHRPHRDDRPVANTASANSPSSSRHERHHGRVDR